MTAVGSRQGTAVRTAAAAALALTLTYLLAVRTPAGQQLDTLAMLDASRALGQQTWTGTFLRLITPATAGAAALGIAALTWMRRDAHAAVKVLLTSGATALSALALKAVLTRPDYVDTSHNSLPSGHVAAVAGLAVAVVQAVAPRRRRFVAVIGAAATAATGTATLAKQWHRPSDVLAAMLLAVAVGALTTAVRPSIGSARARLGRPFRSLRFNLDGRAAGRHEPSAAS